ncbi:TcfC E-set like domain-containing protein [Burkholderia cepacia]|uniref:TcfC E-set like domain-containing protein n=1 Tax=Burkholderia cepacia TaxID=292 RepID=UPI0009BEE3C9|nr:TcfC E-set like domain-containing protein [Burkholderia cepacia]
MAKPRMTVLHFSISVIGGWAACANAGQDIFSRGFEPTIRLNEFDARRQDSRGWPQAGSQAFVEPARVPFERSSWRKAGYTPVTRPYSDAARLAVEPVHPVLAAAPSPAVQAAASSDARFAPAQIQVPVAMRVRMSEQRPVRQAKMHVAKRANGRQHQRATRPVKAVAGAATARGAHRMAAGDPRTESKATAGTVAQAVPRYGVNLAGQSGAERDETKRSIQVDREGADELSLQMADLDTAGSPAPSTAPTAATDSTNHAPHADAVAADAPPPELAETDHAPVASSTQTASVKAASPSADSQPLATEADTVSVGTPPNTALEAGRYRFPEELLGSLEQGIDVPVRLMTATGTEQGGEATVKYVNGALTLTGFKLSKATLTDAARARVEAMYGKPLSVVDAVSAAVAGNDKLRLEFNLPTFELIARLPATAYSSVGESRSRVLPDSTEKHLSGVINYDASGVKNARSEAVGYLHLQSVTGYGVNHAYVEGDVRSGEDSTLYEARLERDFRGINVTAGYLSTWAMSNALGQTTFLPGGRFVGVSAGNASRSEIRDGTLARTPIFVFMPASGEAQIYRDGKLVDVQQLPLGNQEIDTRPLPVGVYPVRIDVVINGKVVSSSTEQVYKPGGSATGADKQLQVFVGRYTANTLSDGRSVSRPLIGFSGQRVTKFGTFFGSGYVFNGLGALEARFQKDFSQGTIGIDTGGTSDGGFRLNLNGSVNFGAGGAWVTHSVTTGATAKNGVYNSRMTSFGGNFSFGRAFNWKRNATVNINANLYDGGQDYRVDLSQDIYVSRRTRVSLNVGESFNRNTRAPGTQWNKAFYIGMNASFSFGDAGIDYSRGRGSEQIGAHVGWRPDNLKGIDYLSAGVNRMRSVGGDSGFNSSSTQANFGASGHNRWIGWQASSSVDDSGNVNGSGAFNGSVGWNGSGVGFNSRKGESGVIVNVDKTARGNLDLISPAGRMSLDGRSTFVPLTGYEEHKVQVRTRRDTPENFDIQNDEAKLVLYPGNVASMQPKIRRLVTVFGVLTEHGTVKPNTEIHNHIGKAMTAADGGFVIDVDAAYPVIQHRSANGVCEVDFDLSKAQGAVWVDKVECAPKQISSDRIVVPAG